MNQTIINELKEEMRVDSTFEPYKSEPAGETIKVNNNDGGRNHFYDIPEWVVDVDDLAEYLELNYALGNVLKSLWINIGTRHAATNENREAKKRVHYANRELNRINK